ncbi:unnamed protein product, partial [Ectocarpus sp. 13 AM-2016]
MSWFIKDSSLRTLGPQLRMDLDSTAPATDVSPETGGKEDSDLYSERGLPVRGSTVSACLLSAAISTSLPAQCTLDEGDGKHDEKQTTNSSPHAVHVLEKNSRLMANLR